MDFKLVDEAMVLVRQHSSSDGRVPPWNRYQQLVTEHLRDDFDPRPKMPAEYYYAYLRAKGLKHAESLRTMGLEPEDTPPGSDDKPFWKFW